MRALLIAPADEHQLAGALTSGADAIVVDLARAAPASRAAVTKFLKHAHGRGGPALIVRIHALDSGETDADLDTVMAGAPDAILLPGSLGTASVQQLAAKLAVREAEFALTDGVTRIIAVADTAQSLFQMASYRGSTSRLIGVAWDAESLRADIGAETDRAPLEGYLDAYRLARVATLLAATSAQVAAIDAAFPDIDDLDGLRAEALAARRDGFTGKVALDRAQVAVINEIFPGRISPVAKSGA